NTPVHRSTDFSYTTLVRSRQADPGGEDRESVPGAAVGDDPIGSETSEGPGHGQAVASHKSGERARHLTAGADDEGELVLPDQHRSEEHTSELQSRFDLVCH